MSVENPSEGRLEEEKQIEMGEPLESKELFDLLTNAGLKGFKPEFVQELGESGTEKEDVDLAIKFMACLTAVNGLVFNDRVELIFNTGEEEPENFIQYSPKREGEYDENYWISIGHFGKIVRKQMGENHRVFLDKNSHLIKYEEDAPPVLLEELLLGIAVHEVRHRLQEKKQISMIGGKDKVILDGNYIDPNFIKLQASFIKGLRGKSKKAMDAGLLERKTGNRELDAVIVEKVAVSRLHHRRTSLEQLKQLATIEPEK